MSIPSFAAAAVALAAVCLCAAGAPSGRPDGAVAARSAPSAAAGEVCALCLVAEARALMARAAARADPALAGRAAIAACAALEAAPAGPVRREAAALIRRYRSLREAGRFAPPSRRRAADAPIGAAW